jgi:hypothetical protein
MCFEYAVAVEISNAAPVAIRTRPHCGGWLMLWALMTSRDTPRVIRLG